jgi:hypothetical protein
MKKYLAITYELDLNVDYGALDFERDSRFNDYMKQAVQSYVDQKQNGSITLEKITFKVKVRGEDDLAIFKFLGEVYGDSYQASLNIIETFLDHDNSKSKNIKLIAIEL